MKNLALSLLIKAKDKAGATVVQLKGKISSLGSKGGTAAKGTDKLNRSLDNTKKSGGRAKTALLAVGGVLAGLTLGFARVVRSAKAWVDAANIQQRAETKLATTLKNLTNASDEEVEALKRQAAALQELTGYGDESTISAQAMLGTFRLSAKEIAQLTPRLLDMAESQRKAGETGADLESISIAVGKAFSSGIGSLSRYGIAMSDAQKEAFKLADQSEKVKILAEVLDGNFKGLAAAIGQEYEGAVRKAQAAHGDFYEVLGKQITDNPAIVAATNDITNAWKEAAQGIVDSSAEIGEAISFFGNTVRVTFAGIKAAWNITQIAFKGLVLTINSGIEGINTALSLITWGDISKEFKAAADEIRAENIKMRISIVDDVEDIKDAGGKMVKVFTDVKGEVKEIPSLVRELGKESKKAADEMENTAESGGLLAAELKKVGISLDEIKTGLKTGTVDQLRAMGLAMGDTALEGDNLVDTLLAIAKKSNSPVVLAKAMQYVDQAFKDGRISADQQATAISGIVAQSDKAADSLDGLSKAYDGRPTRKEIDGVIAKLRELYKQDKITKAQLQAGTAQAEEQYRKIGDAVEETGKKTHHQIGNEISDLKRLRDEGAISEEEFNRQSQEKVAQYRNSGKAAKESGEQAQESDRLTIAEQQKNQAKRNAITQQQISNSKEAEAAQKKAAEAQYQASRDGGFLLEALITRWQQATSELSKYGAKAVEVFSKRAGGFLEGLHEEITVTDKLTAARRNLWAANERLWSTSGTDQFNTYLNTIEKAFAQTEIDAIKAQSRFESTLKLIKSGKVSLAQLGGMGAYAAGTMSILGEEKLSALNAAISQAKNELESMNQSAKGTLQSLQDELDKLNGKTVDLEARRAEARRRDIEAKLEEAKANTGKDLAGRPTHNQAVLDLQMSLQLLDQIDQKRRQTKAAQAQAQDTSKAVQAGVEAALGGKLAKVDIGGVEVLAPEASIDLLRQLNLSRAAS